MLGRLWEVAKNEITTKMASNEINATKAEEPVQVTTKNPKKVAAGKRLAECNRRNKEKLAWVAKAQESEPKLSYGVGAVISVVLLGLLGYYIYESKKADNR